MNTCLNKKRKYLALLLLIPSFGFCGGQLLPGDTYLSNPLFNTLLGVIIFLMIILVVLSQVLKNLGKNDYLINKTNDEKNDENSNGPAKIIGVILLCFTVLSSQAQGASSNAGSWTVGGLDMFTFYFMLGVIVLEAIFLIVLLITLNSLLKTDKVKILQPEKKAKSLIEILNASVEIEREDEILMDHEYDGIRELDNNLPPWWRYGFYLTIIVAVIYLIHFHVTKTGDLQIAEYTKEIEKGKADVAEFMKKSANNVDETTIKMLGMVDIEAGKENFINACAACHGKFGEGGVGPNMTDEYWMHGGSLSDVFKSIKYGWPDKGMKSWKEDFSPIQMAQLVSFIRTLKGTNPPKGKPAQGDLYTEKGEAVSDSLSNPKDSLQIKLPGDTTSIAKAADEKMK